MNIVIFSFTKSSVNLNKKITKYFENKCCNVKSFLPDRIIKDSDSEFLNIGSCLKDTVSKNFNNSDALIFIGSTGIAVRSIASFIKSKDKDPAVIVIDEKAKFVIPVLSGHIGGANDISRELSIFLKGEAVITTATDLNNKFAVDIFAKENKLFIDDISMIKVISSRVLEEKNVYMIAQNGKIYGKDKSIKILKDDYDFKCIPENDKSTGICISITNKKPFDYTINLIPRSVIVGIGCKRGIEKQNIIDAVYDIFKKNNINIKGIKKICSIDIKKNEKGIIDFAKDLSVPFEVYSASDLSKVKGTFTSSSFVKKITGVDNVCERSACFGAIKDNKNYSMLAKKATKNGVTVAIVSEDWSVKL